jgi:hypothetical protein
LFLRASDVARVNRDIGERYLEMVLMESQYAVPTGSVRAASALTVDRPGTFWGTGSRLFMQFKTFGVNVMLLHAGRVFREMAGGRKGRGAAYAGGLLISTSLLGGLALQLRQMAQGKDPRDMTDPKFWGSAVLQGGGLGIYGDFLFADLSRTGQGLEAALSGPGVDIASDIIRLGISSPISAIQGEKTNIGRQAVDLLRKYQPGSNLWYTRLAWERIVLDQLQVLADPDAAAAFRRKAAHAKKHYGQDYWWRPGETQARRGPRLDAVTGK